MLNVIILLGIIIATMVSLTHLLTRNDVPVTGKNVGLVAVVVIGLIVYGAMLGVMLA